jgi:predicted nucleotidyltransferase
MDKREVYSLARRYADLVAQDLKPDKIVLYGSAVHGAATDESDIDIAIIFNGFNGDWFGAYRHLSGLRRGVSTYIEPVLLDTANDKSGFAQEVMATGEVLFQQ